MNDDQIANNLVAVCRSEGNFMSVCMPGNVSKLAGLADRRKRFAQLIVNRGGDNIAINHDRLQDDVDAFVIQMPKRFRNHLALASCHVAYTVLKLVDRDAIGVIFEQAKDRQQRQQYQWNVNC